MKYIRMKDGIYKATEINGMIIARGGIAYSCDIADVHYPIVIEKKDIIKQADAIEELCDEFVLEWTVRELAADLQQASDFAEDYELTNYKIYGAIWTDKGLIYVAKMNEKGELELL